MTILYRYLFLTAYLIFSSFATEKKKELKISLKPNKYVL